MGKASKPRAGSLQFWPRKRIYDSFPSVNWDAIEGKGLLGFIGYKVGMTSAFLKDSTPNSMTKDKKIIIPATVLEIPPLKVFSVRFYKFGKVVKEVYSDNLDKELKRILKVPKKKSISFDEVKDFEDIRLLVYSKVRDTDIKKTPDMIELAFGGSLDEKIAFAKEKLNKEILASEILKDIKLVDIRGITKGKGLVGPVKRFGIRLRQHKSEKGVRRPGTLGPWHPAHVQFRVPMAGQLGLFSRIQFNSKVLNIGKISEKNINPKEGWKHFGNIKTEYIILDGSVPGPEKRQMLITQTLRASKKQVKKNYEFLGIVR